MPQRIFISYRRDDTRALAEKIDRLLRAEFPRKSIFFDVNAPEPGSVLIEKIDRELESAQIVIALIGPDWNRGRRLDHEHDYVRHELKRALSLRREKNLRILPVLVGGAKLPIDELPADLKAMADLEYLHIEGESGIPAIIQQTKEALPRYWVGGHDDIVRWSWDWVDLLKRLIQLDVDEVPTIDTVPRDPLLRARHEARRLLEKLGLRTPDPGDEGSAEQWASVFERHPQTWRIIFSKEDEIVAYWHVAPLNDDDYRKLIAGRFKAGMVKYEKLTLFEKKSGIYNLFFVITVVDENHRNVDLHRYLFFSFFEVLDKLASAEEPVFIAEVAADVWTDEGIKLAQGFGMKRVGSRIDNPDVLIYNVPITDVLNAYIAKQRYPALRQRYQEAGFVVN